MQKPLDKLEHFLLLAIVFLFPLTVLPISPNPFIVPKLALLSFGVTTLLLIKALRVISEGQLQMNVGKYDLPVALIAIAYLASAILRTPNKMEAFLLPGTATIAVSSALLYFLINQLDKKGKNSALTVLFLSATVFSLLELLAYSKVLAKIPQLPAFMKAEFFNPEGGFLPAALFFAAMLPIGIGHFLVTKNAAQKALFATCSSIIFFGLVISVYNLLPGKPYAARFPSYSVGWNIAVDSLKESPLLGIGPGNYLTAFNRFRPLSFNSTNLWAVKYATARSFYLTALTETGMVGIAGIILLLLAIYRNVRAEMKEAKSVGWGLQVSPKMLSLVIILVLLALFPITLLTFTVTFIVLASVTPTGKTTLNLQTQGAQGVGSKLPAILIAGPIIILVALFYWRAGRALAAEYTFNQAINALAQNKAQLTYDLMAKAINTNPQVDRYHSTNSQINLALANSIAQTAEITDTDRANIAQLVQQAIAEAKAAVALNPLRAGNWEILGRTYQTIIPLAQGADTFAIQTYAQAAALDPMNPNLRVALGGIHYSRGDYDSAIRVFELATLTKSDHANAHYNLAFAYRDAGQIDKAINEITLVLSLIDRSANDYEIARTTLEDLQSRKASAQPQAGTELTPPQEEQEPVLQPPLQLEEESQPPEAPLSPTPSPSPEVTGEVTGTSTPSPQLTPTPQP